MKMFLCLLSIPKDSLPPVCRVTEAKLNYLMFFITSLVCQTYKLIQHHIQYLQSSLEQITVTPEFFFKKKKKAKRKTEGRHSRQRLRPARCKQGHIQYGLKIVTVQAWKPLSRTFFSVCHLYQGMTLHRRTEHNFNRAQYVVTLLTQKEINNIKDPSTPQKETYLSLSNLNQQVIRRLHLDIIIVILSQTKVL